MALPGEPINEIPTNDPAPAEEVVTDDNGGQEYDETTPEGDSGSTDGAPEAPEAPEAPAADDDPYAAYGGKEAVERAMQLNQMLQTQEGVQRLYMEAAQVLGVSPAQAEALLSGGGQPQEEQPQFADDDLITWGQVKDLLQKEVLQPWQQTEAQRAEQSARQAVHAAKTELGIEDEATWNAVLQLGDRHLGDDLSPDAVAAAVRKGHEEFVNLVKGNAQKYVQKKVATKAAVPKAPAGGSMPAPAPDAEPKTVQEAIDRARKRLMAG